MNPQTKKALNHILEPFPQIEISLTENQLKIVQFLRTQKHPKRAKMISTRLNIDYNTVRARLSELKALGFVFQPGKETIHIAELDTIGTSILNVNGFKCGYLATNPSIVRR